MSLLGPPRGSVIIITMVSCSAAGQGWQGWEGWEGLEISISIYFPFYRIMNLLNKTYDSVERS